MMSKVVRKNVTIREEQAEWLARHHINLSRFVQAKIEELRREYEGTRNQGMDRGSDRR